MTVQISVTVWTVICFILLMLILHNLLFKPILLVMDRRRERIENAEHKEIELQRHRQEQAIVLAEKKEAFYRERAKQIKDEIESIRLEMKKRVEVAQDERLECVESFREGCERDHADIMNTLSAHKSELAALFAESLIQNSEGTGI